MSSTPPIRLSAFQKKVLAVPLAYDLALPGGRGGGKSWAIALLILAHIEQHPEQARCLYFRRSFPGIVDFEGVTREVFGRIYGSQASYNAAGHIWRFPGGATLQLDQLDGHADFPKFQGKSFTLIAGDEAGQYEDPAIIDLLRSCLRAAAPIQPRFILAANPGGPGHAWVAQRHALKAPWLPYKDDKTARQWVTAPSTLEDNDHLNQDEYRGQLAAATATDPELGKAWILGDWTVLRGAFFSQVLDQGRNMIDDIEPADLDQLRRRNFRFFLAHDYGLSAPSVTLLMAEVREAVEIQGKHYRRGSFIVMDELATNAPGQLNTGMGYTVDRLADMIREMAAHWKVPPTGAADDACFSRTGLSAGSLADEFRKHRVYFNPAKKADRKTGWERLRQLLKDAGQPDKPGLFICRRCEYLWQTLPALPRDPRKPDDVDSRAADHGADALRYALTSSSGEMKRIEIGGV